MSLRDLSIADLWEIHKLHEMLRIINTPTDFEAACVMAHEVRQ